MIWTWKYHNSGSSLTLSSEVKVRLLLQWCAFAIILHTEIEWLPSSVALSDLKILKIKTQLVCQENACKCVAVNIYRTISE